MTNLITYPLARPMSYALTAALGTIMALGTPSWVIRDSAGVPAKLYRDPNNSKYWFNGRSYGSEATFLTASGGVISSAARVFGPYLDPLLVNKFSNGDFASGVLPWAAFNAGASIANVGGECELTSGGSLNGFSQAVTGCLGRAFRFAATGRQGTSANQFFMISAINNVLNSGNGFATPFSTTSPASRSYLCAGVADTTYFGIRNSSGAGAGTALFDNLSLIEATPFVGWTPNSFLVLVERTAPAGHASAEVIVQADADTERDRIRLVRGTDLHVHFIVTANNNELVNLDLGVVADSAAFSVAFYYNGTSYAVSIDGAPPQTATNISPGLAVMRVNRSFTGEAWTGADGLTVVI